MVLETIDSEEQLKKLTKENIIDFLYTHLDQFRDDKESIRKCLDYTFSTTPGKGGFILTSYLNSNLVGILVMNNTGMEGYIPENLLVYIAVHSEYRGKGIGKRLIQEVINRVSGDIKLHVEYDNPAKKLYERLGFTTKYAEMRYTQKE